MSQTRDNSLSPHSPDCSTITDDELKNAVTTYWPRSNGVATIPYSFSTKPFWSQIYFLTKYYRFSPEYLRDQQMDLLKNEVQDALASWTLASNNTLQFIESTSTHPFAPGIFFYLGANEETFSQEGSGAFTAWKLGFDGMLNQAMIFFPDNTWFLDKPTDAWSLLTKTHEIGHALGLEHLHDYPVIQQKLQNTVDGVFCSVMPYPELVSSDISRCKTLCHPPYTVYPTALDARMIALSFNGLTMNYFGKDQLLGYLLSIYDATIPLFTIGCAYNATATFISKLAIYKNKSLFSEKFAYLVADSGMIAGLVTLEFPTWMTLLYAATSSTKFLPENWLNKLPNRIQAILMSNYNFYALNAAYAYLIAPRILPCILANTISYVFTPGRTTQNCIGKALSWSVNLIPQTITSRLCHSSERSAHVAAINNIDSDMHDINSHHSSAEFHSLPDYSPTPISTPQKKWFQFFSLRRSASESQDKNVQLSSSAYRV